MTRSTNSSSYRDRLRTLYNRRPSTNSTGDTAGRRRSQIVNRDLNDRFGKRLDTGLRTNGSRIKTGLRKLDNGRARYNRGASARRLGNSSSTARSALAVGNRRDLLSTRAPTAVRQIPRLRNSGSLAAGHRSPTSLARASHDQHGGYHSSGHFSSLHFGFGLSSHHSHWGLYAYPYHYSHYLPYSYYRGHSSFAIYWNSHYPYYRSAWWWPSYAYAPGAWSGYHSGYYSAPSYYYPSYSSTVIYGVESGSSATEAPSDVEGEATRIARLAQEHLDLGDFYFKQGRYKEAAESYMRALAYSPDDGSIHFVVADALFAQGDYHYAAFMISKGLELDPDLAFAETDKRTFYEDPTVFDRQLETLRGYLLDKPFDAAVHMVLGYSLVFSEDRPAAAAPLARALEIDPGNRAAKALLDALDGKRKPARKLEAKAGELEKKGR